VDFHLAVVTRLLQEFNNQQTRHISILSTDLSVQYISHSPTPSIQEVASPPPLCICIATDGIGHHPSISPSSAETILHMEDNNFTNTAHAIAYGLITTVQQCTAITDQRLTEACRCINQLTGTVHSHESEICCLRNGNRNPKMPPKFEHNRGWVDIQVSSHSGKNVIARWIRVMGNSEVVARAGEHTNKPEYMVSLYLPSDYSQQPTSTLPQWFIELLQARGGPYHTLAEAAHSLKHPTTYTEVECYSCHHQCCAELEVDQWAIVAKIEREDKALQGIKHRMEAYGLHEQLAQLEGRMDICRKLPMHNYALCCPNSCCYHHGGPGGPP